VIVLLNDLAYRSQAEPSFHSDAIKSRGSWISGVIDPSVRGRSQIDGNRMIEQCSNLGLMPAMADNSVEAGIQSVWQRLSSGGLRVFLTCQSWFFGIPRLSPGRRNALSKNDILVRIPRTPDSRRPIPAHI
jgi:hypothetical protein